MSFLPVIQPTVDWLRASNPGTHTDEYATRDLDALSDKHAATDGDEYTRAFPHRDFDSLSNEHAATDGDKYARAFSHRDQGARHRNYCTVGHVDC